MHKIYIGSPCSGRVPRAIQPAWAHPARAIIQTTLLAIFPFEESGTCPARPEAWASRGRHFDFLVPFHLFLISGAIPKVKKYIYQKSAWFASLGLAGVQGRMKKKKKKKKNKYIFKSFQTFWKQFHTNTHSTHTRFRRLRDWQMSIFNLPNFCY